MTAKAPKPGTPPTSPTLLPAGTTCAHCGGDDLPQRDRHSRCLVRLRHQLVRRLRIRPRSEGRLRRIPERGQGQGPLSRRRRPAPRLVPLFAAHLRRPARPRALLACRHRRLDARRAGPRHVQVARQRRRSRRHRQPHGRRNRSPLGRLHRLPRRHGRQRKPDGALRRNLPQAAQHLPLPARQPQRLRSSHATRFPKPSFCPSTATCWPAPAS